MTGPANEERGPDALEYARRDVRPAPPVRIVQRVALAYFGCACLVLGSLIVLIVSQDIRRAPLEFTVLGFVLVPAGAWLVWRGTRPSRARRL